MTRIVVGSINLDLVAGCERLPRAGVTVSGATFSRFPGGKGANQAVACARLGAEVTLIGAIGADPFAEEALAGLRETAWEQCTGLFCLNAAPARPVTADPDLTAVNRHELELLSRRVKEGLRGSARRPFPDLERFA